MPATAWVQMMPAILHPAVGQNKIGQRDIRCKEENNRMIRLEKAAKGYEGGFRTLGTPENWDRISEAYRTEIFRRAEEYARQAYPIRAAGH